MAIFNRIGWCVVVAGLFIGRLGNATVRMDDLPDLAVDGIGVTTVFPASVWQGGGTISDLTEQVRGAGRLSLLPAEREILRQLILTDTSAEPALVGGDGSFWTARADALMAQGLFEDVIELVDQVPVEQQTPVMKQRRSAALFGAGRITEACAEKTMAVWEDRENAVRAACVFYQGSREAAALAFDVYREGGSDDVWMTAAGSRLFLGRGEQPADEPDLWAIGLAAAAFGVDGMEGWPRGLLRAAALNPQVPADVRLVAAEKGALQAKDWQTVLEAVATADKADHSKKVSEVRERARLYQAAVAASDKKRFEAVRDLLAALRKAGVMEAWAPVVSPLAISVEVQSERADTAADMIVACAWANELTAAHAWYVVLSEKDAVAALRLSGVLNAMGAGVPKSIDPLIRACVAAGNCAEALRGIPFYFPASPAMAAQVPSIQGGYPGFVTGVVWQQIADGAVGAGLLNGLGLLSRSAAVERPLVETIMKAVPRGMGEAVLRERLLRGL